jgi:ABC-2 type transport system ATP-binding protein
MTASLSLRGVQKKYDDFALQDIDLELPTGQIMGLVGVNGAGKSTLLRILMGLVQADSGEVEIRGHRLPQAQVAAKREIGYASEDMRLYKGKTLRWHMDFIQTIYPGWDEAYAGELLKRFDLRPLQELRGFSHGQRVKALLLLVLARHPKVLLLDEPTTGLDPIARSEVLGALADVLRDEERSVLFSSHNTSDVEQLSDSITFIHRGQIVASQDKESFLDSWRRILCQGTWRDSIATLPGVASARNNGSVIELKVNNFSEDFVPQLQQLGLTVKTIEPMNLEDIFVTSIRARATS